MMFYALLLFEVRIKGKWNGIDSKVSTESRHQGAGGSFSAALERICYPLSRPQVPSLDRDGQTVTTTAGEYCLTSIATVGVRETEIVSEFS